MAQIASTLSGVVLSVLIGLGATAANAEVQGEIIPLPPDVETDLALLGEGVVGKPVPAPPIHNIEKLLNIGPGVWKYNIVAGGKDGAKVRTETYTEIAPYEGSRAWKRELGEEYVEYLHMHPDGSFVKHSEDDADVDYTTDFDPGILFPIQLKPGEPQTHVSRLSAFKTGERGHTAYSGKATMEISYVGAYEVTTPAGTWPAVLVQTKFDIHLGPAKVSDRTYVFLVEKVGRVAEIEVTNVSALLIYHSHTKIAKVLSELPMR